MFEKMKLSKIYIRGDKTFDSENPGSSKKSKWGTIDHFLGSWGVLTPTSILIFIALFEFGLGKMVYIDLMQVL